MKTYLALLALTCMTSLAQADLYDDRAKLGEQRAAQIQIKKMQQAAAVRLRQDIATVEKFAQKHGGYAQRPDCYDFSYDSNGGVFSQGTHKQCSPTMCVNVHGSRYKISDAYAGDPNMQFMYLNDQRFYYCKVVLKNGLACQLNSNYETKTVNGDCLDNQGNKHELSSALM